MWTRTCTLLLLVGFGLVPRIGAAEPAGKDDTAAVARLIQQLGSEQFAEREAASKALDEVGLPALDPLRKATASPDGEVARRARELVERLERRQETARALETPRLRLVYKDMPISDVIADVARKTGFPLLVDEKEKARLSQRRITLDTGEVTFWEAIDQLCDKAGLMEIKPAVPQTPAQTDPYAAYIRKSSYINPYGRLDTGTDGRVTLAEGKRSPLPTHLAGALRIQALPGKGAVAGVSPQEGESVFALEVSPAAGMDLQDVVSLRVHRAVDDKGTLLVQPGAYLGGQSVYSGYSEEIMIFVEGGYDMPAYSGPRRHQLPVQLKTGSQPSRTVKELQGTLAAHVVTPPRPVMTVDNILKAAGRTVKGTEGGVLKVLDVKDDGGKVTLKVHLEPPADSLGTGALGAQAALQQAVIIRRQLGRANALGALGNVPRDLALLDTRGQTIPPQNARPVIGPNGDIQEYELTYLLQKDQQADKLTYTARRRVLIEVPFTLKDVPLP